jgi:hypothetical protein
MQNFLLSATKQAEQSRLLNINVCKRQAILSDHRLISQEEVADRRLRELVFEIIGEYGKSHIRLSRRKEYMRDTGRNKLVISMWSLRWGRFCAVLKKRIILSICNNSGAENTLVASLKDADKSLKCRLLLPQRDRDEIGHVKKILTKHLSAIPGNRLESFECLSIVKVSKTGLQTKSAVDTEASHKEQKVSIAKSTTDLQAFESILHKWAYKHIIGSSGSNKQPPSSSLSKGSQPRVRSQSALPLDAFNIRCKEALKNILSAQCISWLHPTSFYPIIWDGIQSHLRGTSAYSYIPLPFRDYCIQAKSFPYMYVCMYVYNVFFMYDVGDVTSAVFDQQSSRDDFIRRYYLQFSSTLYNDTVYICLEERQLVLSAAPMRNRTTSTETFDDGDTVLALLTALEVRSHR